MPINYSKRCMFMDTYYAVVNLNLNTSVEPTANVHSTEPTRLGRTF